MCNCADTSVALFCCRPTLFQCQFLDSFNHVMSRDLTPCCAQREQFSTQQQDIVELVTPRSWRCVQPVACNSSSNSLLRLLRLCSISPAFTTDLLSKNNPNACCFVFYIQFWWTITVSNNLSDTICGSSFGCFKIKALCAFPVGHFNVKQQQYEIWTVRLISMRYN